MATVPTGPNSSLPASPAKITPLPGDRSLGPGADACGCGAVDLTIGEDQGRESQVTAVKRSIQKKQKNMLAHASPSALHLKVQHPEQQQMNGLVSPVGPADTHSPHEHVDNRPDNPRPSVENCDSCDEGTSSYDNIPELCQHEGHSPFSNNSSHPLLKNSSMNGMPSITRTGACPNLPKTIDAPGIQRNEGEDCHPSTPGPSGDGEGDYLEDGTCPGDGSSSEPPVAELARLDLKGPPCTAIEDNHGINYVRYESELQMPWIMRLITKDLSEPYSIYTYRYFIHNWPQLCFLAMVEQECVGAIVCKLDMHKKMFRRGYIAMLAVDSKHRRKSIGTNLVKKAIYAMVEGDCDEVVLETEITNKSALKLYENLGFVRDKRLFRYYLNGVDALRLKLWLR
ncbi:N-alpha-acetyltransferase 30 [Gadus morhua]|uniref:N-alpha-acetyltransferase 30 n=1 Tax=Gadus morhua TaxID=8049 RepID=UPI0011B3BB81|nr:N-alpha-acetyltransferase 30 [Gadus morhua]